MNTGAATYGQVGYAKKLLDELGYDADDYDFDNMTYWEVAKLIEELKEELEG